jgi:hypothetical protein
MVVSGANHAAGIVSKLWGMVERHGVEIKANLTEHGRSWGDLANYFPDNMLDLTTWEIDHTTIRGRKSLKLVTPSKQASPRESITSVRRQTIGTMKVVEENHKKG